MDVAKRSEDEISQVFVKRKADDHDQVAKLELLRKPIIFEVATNLDAQVGWCMTERRGNCEVPKLRRGGLNHVPYGWG